MSGGVGGVEPMAPPYPDNRRRIGCPLGAVGNCADGWGWSLPNALSHLHPDYGEDNEQYGESPSNTPTIIAVTRRSSLPA
ncbi:MAG: hypothetical protein AAF639_35395 [Chloroflexota bacterium]